MAVLPFIEAFGVLDFYVSLTGQATSRMERSKKGADAMFSPWHITCWNAAKVARPGLFELDFRYGRETGTCRFAR